MQAMIIFKNTEEPTGKTCKTVRKNEKRRLYTNNK
jgi:hypothetical protein